MSISKKEAGEAMKSIDWNRRGGWRLAGKEQRGRRGRGRIKFKTLGRQKEWPGPLTLSDHLWPLLH